MREQKVDVVDEYYAGLLGVDRASLWHDVTVRAHSGRLRDVDGLYVVRRDQGVHVSAPAGEVAATRRALETADPSELRDLTYWRGLANDLGRRVVGPSTHAYLDRDPGAVPGVTEVSLGDLEGLRATVGAAEWSESGWDDDPGRVFGLLEGDHVMAAANLNLFHHGLRDVGVLVAPPARGRGLALPVAQHAASVAVRDAGFARWGARQGNTASVAVSRRLGFEPWCSQLALR